MRFHGYANLSLKALLEINNLRNPLKNMNSLYESNPNFTICREFVLALLSIFLKQDFKQFSHFACTGTGAANVRKVDAKRTRAKTTRVRQTHHNKKNAANASGENTLHILGNDLGFEKRELLIGFGGSLFAFSSGETILALA